MVIVLRVSKHSKFSYAGPRQIARIIWKRTYESHANWPGLAMKNVTKNLLQHLGKEIVGLTMYLASW